MSTGYVKVMLLLLGTFSFAAIWSNDHRPVTSGGMNIAEEIDASHSTERSSIASQIELPSVTFPATEIYSSSEPLEWINFPSALHSTMTELTEQRQTDTTWVLLDELEFVRIDAFENPLPCGIAPGNYRVIDRFGNVSTQSISLEIAIETGFEIGSNKRDSYTARENEDRWHFIRIERDLIAERESQVQAEVQKAWTFVFRVIEEKTERPLQDLRRPIVNWLSPQKIADDRSAVRR